MVLDGLSLPDTEKQSYNIHIMSRNGSVMQMVRFLKVNGEWRIASKTMRGDDVLEEVIDPDFPRNESGEVQW